ncbi:hypothetical protein KA005_31855 [bacterium]|nr:hypothetical protein [bacterium]
MNDEKNNQKNQGPTDNEFEEMLVQFKPVPGKSFHIRMQTAPWKKTSSLNHVAHSSTKFMPRSQTMRLAVLVSSILILTIIGFAAAPTIKTAAKQFFSFFISAETDTISIPITVGQDGNLVVYDTPGYFSMDIAAITEKIEFDMLIIPEQPQGVKYSGANYNKETASVTIQYHGADKTIYFTQRPTDSMLEFSSVGASAPIESVIVKGQPGEFVVGGWRALENNSITTPDHMMEINGNLNIYWDPNQSQRIIRWEGKGVTYEILAIGQGLSKAILLEIAESLAPIPTK